MSVCSVEQLPTWVEALTAAHAQDPPACCWESPPQCAHEHVALLAAAQSQSSQQQRCWASADQPLLRPQLGLSPDAAAGQMAQPAWGDCRAGSTAFGTLQSPDPARCPSGVSCMQVANDNTLPPALSLRPTTASPASRRLHFCRHALTWRQQLPETPPLYLRQWGTERPSPEAPGLQQSQHWAAASWLPQCPPLHPPALLPLQ